MKVLDFSKNKWITHIPDVSSAKYLETLDFSYCVNLTKIDESVGRLDNLRILNLRCCEMLRSLPSLMLPSLERLQLLFCSRLESFPEILGKTEQLRVLSLFFTSIKELPHSICNLTRLQDIQVRNLELKHHSLLVPSSIFMLRELNKLSILGFERLLLPNQDEGAEKVSLVVSSSIKDLRLSDCKLSDELLQLFLPRFSNVKKLDLSGNDFTILPAWIKGCHSLRSLHLDDCQNLQEIGGIPPKIEFLTARHCTSMSCSSRELLSNKVSLYFWWYM